LAFESGNIPKETLDYLASKSHPEAKISKGRKISIFLLSVLTICILLFVVYSAPDKTKEINSTNEVLTHPTPTVIPYQPKELIAEAADDIATRNFDVGLAVIAKLQDSDRKSAAVQSMFNRATREVHLADAKNARASRLEYAKNYERQLLASGEDYTVRAQGPDADTLSVTFVLINRPFVYNIENDADLKEQWSALGFKKVRLGDGFDSSWSYSLK
jgi:hypothetical protein